MTPMSRWLGPLLAAGICAAGAAGRGDEPAIPKDVPGAPELVNPPTTVERMPYNPQATRKIVTFWEGKARKNARGALELRELAGAYLARQRESGDIADAVLAEDAARRSLAILPRNNAAAMNRLARSLLAQHRFPEALEVANRAAALDPEINRLVADIQLELGDYAAAEAALALAPGKPDDPNAKMLRARIDQIDGKPAEALRLMEEARAIADKSFDMPREAVAWYHTMIGHALIDSGKLDDGERACREALEVFPNDYRAMTGLAEAATWRGDWAGAIAWGEKAIAIAPQNPEALKLIGEAHAARGESEAAEREYKLLETLAHSFPRIYDRHWALFCADHDRDLDEALALARKDLELRKDIHGHDALAWVAFKKGLQAEAEAAMKRALARGIAEAPLLLHAGVIARAGGDRAGAAAYFARARALNPYLMKAAEPADAK